MLQRIVTGVAAAALLIVVMLIRGWVFDIVVLLATLLACYELIAAFEKAELRIARWVVYGMAALMLPAYRLLGIPGIFVLGCAAMMGIMLQIALRKEPRWTDAAASITVLVSAPVPLSLLCAIIRIAPDQMGALLVFAVFAISFLGDTCAYFVGVAVGSHRMVPALSPKKTWEGAAGGLLGSALGALLIVLCGEAFGLDMPPIWHFAILGLVGGVAGQLGDLSASMIKRFCGIKDFGSIFPGHGGMMDRMDSVIFVSYVVFGYCLLIGLLP